MALAMRATGEMRRCKNVDATKENKSMYLSRMTWEDIRKYLQENDALLIPIGTCEQHGKHSPLGTDSFVVKRICEQLAEKYNLLIAPIINYGIHFDVDSDYPGAASLTSETVKSIFSDLRETWVRQGFQKLIVVTFHGVPEHHETLENLGEHYYLIKASEGNIADILEKQERMIHSCEAETSVMLHLHPELLEMDRAVDADDLDDFGEHLRMKKRFDINIYPGNFGYSTLATKEKGEKILNRLLENIDQSMKEIL